MNDCDDFDRTLGSEYIIHKTISHIIDIIRKRIIIINIIMISIIGQPINERLI